MNPEYVTKRQGALWLAAALLAPVAHTASRCSWLTVLMVGTAIAVVDWLLPKYLHPPGKWLVTLQGLWSCVVISQILRWNGDCWPSHERPYGASLILLLLAAWSARGGRKRNAGVACVLLWPVGLLLGAVFLSALPGVKAERLGAQWSAPDAWLLVVLLLPLINAGRQKGKRGSIVLWMLAMALAGSGITSGVLSNTVTRSTSVPVYELSRSIRILGAGGRMESLTAVAMTLGYFVTISYLLSIPSEEPKRRIWLYAIISGGIYLTGVIRDSRIVAVGCILVWIILPVLESLKNMCQKTENNP